MTRYMLDTRTFSHLLRSHPTVTARVLKVPMSSLCISADGRVEDRGLDGFCALRVSAHGAVAWPAPRVGAGVWRILVKYFRGFG
jgi:hypothetical protein